jgi:hypothetical protein
MRLTRVLRPAAILAAAVAAIPLQAADLAQSTVTMLPLPGASLVGISMDYLGYDPVTNAVWVPAGNTGSVDVVDAATKKVTRLSGFPTGEMGSGNRKRLVGPSSVTFGKGTAYIGDRFDSSVTALGRSG